jgi:rhodanese-related sulfurtransferase
MMETKSAEAGELETWSPQEVSEALGAGRIVLIDVRTPQEYVHEHIPGAMLLPMQDFDAAFLPDGGKPVVLHCGSGMRSEKMARKVLGAGMERIAHMDGGMGAWKEAGLTYVGTDPATGAPKPMSKGG